MDHLVATKVDANVGDRATEEDEVSRLERTSSDALASIELRSGGVR